MHQAKRTYRSPDFARFRVALQLTSFVVFLLVVWQWRQAERRAATEGEAVLAVREEAAREKEARLQAQRLVARNALSEGAGLCETGETARGLLWMARALELAEAEGDDDLSRAARLNLAAWQPYLVRLQAELPHPGTECCAVFAADGSLATTGGGDKSARLWDREGRPRGKPLVHRFPVWLAAFSPDGKTLLTGSGGSEGGEGCLWDVATGRLLASWPHASRVLTAAFHPTGATCLTLSVDAAVVRSVPDGKPVGRTIEHPRPARTMPESPTPTIGGFRPDGKLVFTAGEDGTVRFWNAETGEPQGKTLRAGSPILAAAFSPDSRTLLIGCMDGKARLWDADAGLPRSPLMVHRGRVRAVAFSPDGALAATASAIQEVNFQTRTTTVGGGEIQLWRVPTGEAIGQPLPHPKPVESLAFSPKGRRLLTGCENGEARLFLVASGELMAKLRSGGGAAAQVAFRSDGEGCSIACRGGKSTGGARLWRVAPEEGLPRLLLHGDTVRTLCFSPDGGTLFSGGDDRVGRLWEVATGTPQGPPMPHKHPVTLAVFSPDGRSLFTSCEGVEQSNGLPRLRWSSAFWEVADGRKRLDLRLPRRPLCAAFRDGGRALVVGDIEGGVQSHDAATGKPLGPPMKGRGSIHSLAFDADEQNLLTGEDGQAVLYDFKARQERKRLPFGDSAVEAHFCPDGRGLLLVWNGFARVWDREGDECKAPPLFHAEGGIHRLSFGPDGRGILISDGENRARLWDIATGKRIGPAPGQADTPLVAFSPNGRHFAVGGKYGRIALWQSPLPMRGSAERLRLWTETLAGLELDAQQIAHPLHAVELQRRRARLHERGGDPERAMPNE